METKFAAFILTHGRPHNVATYETLKKCGYTGRVYIIIDDEDTCADEYMRLYADTVVQFSKKKIAETFDEGDNFNNRKAIIYARNACFEIAKNLGLTHFIQLDDDYTQFIYKFDSNGTYSEKPIKNLDSVFASLLMYYDKINCFSLAMAQNGDFIGGKNGKWAKEIGPHRKAMNTFICSVNRKFNFFGRLNEDVNTYTNLGYRGKLFLTIPNIAIIQKTTQANRGGMTETYLNGGTYLKSFYSVMYTPSAVKISMMGDKHRRIHHRIKWENCVPKIIQ